MRKITFYILLFGFLSCNSNSDNKLEIVNKDTLMIPKSDTINGVDSEVTLPHGTQILPKSAKTGTFNELSPWFLRTVNFTECQYSDDYPEHHEHNKLQETIKTDSTLSINFSFVETCGSDFLCEVEFISDNCVNLIYHQYNSYASCRCCYGLEFVFGIHEYHDPEFYRQLDLPVIKFVSINGCGKVQLDL